jgi:DNA-binding IclR family transcriptional regulator
VSLKELSKVSGLHPSTAHRILNDMVVTRFVDRVEPGTYRLGMRLLELGNVVKSRLSVREAALDLMRALHNKTQQTVNLSVRQGDEIVYIDRAFSERSGMQVVRAIGGRGPLHLTSTGKLFLSVDEAKAIRAYATRTGLAGHNKNSITDLGRLERELSAGALARLCARQRGTGTGRALHGRRHPRRQRQAGGRPVDLGAGRPAAGRVAGRPGEYRGADFGDAGAPDRA